MSEYQYYESQAPDRPLTQREMRELRKYSTRATITDTRFVNHYEWGNFKGDVSTWMRKYFDAFQAAGQNSRAPRRKRGRPLRGRDRSRLNRAAASRSALATWLAGSET